ncbi:chemotaxis protein CheW [Chitinolyticbacter meiyuanensis]|uniref:chemotaxis protein CheW n=1 Tax=Chitinolyticbacter meiyuanensis TaxID=682798 RepID=UPI0011E5A670|nr:chemotaxis protein CheW [Chitinolyticbacter meiyuanensis]
MVELTQAGAEFLTFTLGPETYAIDILAVQEIRAFDGATPIAHAPAFIKGVMNLRGEIVPLADLRLKFGIGEARYDDYTIVVVLNVGRRVVGVVVDSVSDVIRLTPDAIRPVPEMNSAIDLRYMRGLAGHEGQMVILLDIEDLMLSADMALFDA